MANITLKDRNGNPITYADVHAIAVPTAEGGLHVFSGGLPELTTPAANTDVLEGKQFIDENGIAQSGSMQSRDETFITFSQTDDTVFVNVEEGHYPSMQLSYNCGNTGGNAIMSGVPVTLIEGGTFNGMSGSNLAAFLTVWHVYLQQLTGADMYYMPCTVGLQINDMQIPIEGALLAQDISAKSVTYYGHSVDGSASFSVVYFWDDTDAITIKNISLTVSGSSVPIPDDGISGVVLLVLPYGS